MKYFLIGFLMLLCNISNSVAQHNIGVSYHQSSFVKVGIFAEVFDKGIIEVRILDNFIAQDFSAEISGFYKMVDKVDHEVYGGLGYAHSSIDQLYGLIITAGANFYPFNTKKFGFQVELNPLIRDYGSSIIRVSGGIRYKFFKTGQAD